MIRKLIFVLTMSLVISQLTACGGGGGSGAVIAAVQITALAGTADDSTPGTTIRGGSFSIPVGQLTGISLTRTLSSGQASIDTLGAAIPLPHSINYMVNDSTTLPEKGLIVLLSGGYMNTRLAADPVSTVFFSRSAHLFAKNGYKVVTIEHASDASFYYPAPVGGIEYDPQNLTSTDPDEEINYAWYDDYRANSDHSEDLTEVINAVNLDNLPVTLVGYGRGVISAAANADLTNGVWTVEAIVMLSPATYGGRAFLSMDPVPTNNTFTIPVFITYHSEDACIAKAGGNTGTSPVTVINALRENLIANGNIFEILAVSGGFEDVPVPECGPLTHHGLLGIETGTVGVITDWIDIQLGFLL